MGEYIHTSGDAAPTSAYSRIKAQLSANISHCELSLLECIRSVHPDKHISPVPKHHANLIDFAKAGNAVAILDRDGDLFVNEYRYMPLKTRLETGEGNLQEHISIGCYNYQYQGEDLTVYVTECTIPRGEFALQYILTSKDGVVEAQCPTATKLIKAAGKWSAQLHEQIYVYDSARWIKSHKLWTAVLSASWDDVILEPTMKETLIKDVESFFDSRAVYEEYNVPWKRGIIFHGTPGCGKTISIKALMSMVQKRDVASLYVKSFDAAQGQQHCIRQIFQQARTMAPCLLIFEDLDSLVVDKVRSYFLNEVDGLESNNGILMIGSTNHLDRLDSSISKRPSRFDRKYRYQLPALQERIQYCKYWRAKLQKNDRIDFPEDICDIVAQLTDGFTFAYLKELFIQTLLTIVGERANNVDAVEEEDIAAVAEQAKVVEGSTSLVQEGQSVETTAQDLASPTKPGEKKLVRMMPEVEIPDHLQSNPLMRILCKQAASLWKEMDNTTNDEGRTRIQVSEYR